MDKGFVFFGFDGGCKDAYYLAQENLNIKNRQNNIIFSDKNFSNKGYGKHLGGFSNIEKVNLRGYKFIYQCGNVQNHSKRDKWYLKIKKNGLIPQSIISSESYVHNTSKIGKGSIIYPGVCIMRNVEIGENVIILPNTVINHDSIIGDFSIINSGCVINGDVEIGTLNYIGSGTNIRERCKIGDLITIGMGSLIISNLLEKGIYYGSPAKRKLSDNRM